MKELVLLLFLSFTVSASKSTLQTKLEHKETELIKVAETLELLQRQRCNTTCLDQILACRTGNFYECEERMNLEHGCRPFFGINLAHVSNVIIPKTILESGVNLDSLGVSLKDAICFSSSIQDTFLETWKMEHDAILINFVSNTGAIRRVPTLPMECEHSDDRLSSFYLSAASGPKELVIAFDRGSLMDNSKLKLAKNIAKHVINGLTFVDFVGVVAFSKTGMVIEGKTMLKATEENKRKIINAIDRFNPSTENSSFYIGFETAFDLLEEYDLENFNSNCNHAIMFMTAGYDSGKIRDNTLINYIQIRNSQLSSPATIFYYVLGTNDTIPNLQNISCGTGGILVPVDQTSDITDKWLTLFEYYAISGAANLSIANISHRVSWVEPYDHSLIDIQATTLATPVYDYSVFPPSMFGVVSLDLTIDELKKYSDRFDQFVDTLSERSRHCYRSSMGLCDLETFRLYRGLKICNSPCGPLKPYSSDATCPTPPVLSWMNGEGEIEDLTRCCLATVDIKVLGYTLGFGILAVSVLVAVFSYWRFWSRPQKELPT